ncbi:MAG: nicotinate (nicotinamide) nucleotide adenylyltransferase [Pirellulales bacterium]|nr:nicotinate (nicotinamide) nucleotide adenylyltransferase [Pirellulales bacterium]
MRLGIFGGTFDPVHYGHLLLAECCREQCRLDAVWFLPAAVPPHKQDWGLSPAENRVEMLQLAIAGHPTFAVSRYELDRGGVNYTFETLEHFHRDDPSRELFFLLGADMLLDLPNWRRPERILELALPLAARRPGAGELDFAELAPFATPERIAQIRAHQVEMPQVDISGSEIRRRAAAGLSIRYRTPRAVEQYIETQGLYS